MHSDWMSLYSFYISSKEITLRDCSEKFGSSYASLRQKAASERWSERKAQLYMSALNTMEIRTREEIAKRNEEQIQQARFLQNKGMKAIMEMGARPLTFEEARKSIQSGIELERQALGMNTLPTLKISHI